MEHFTGQVQSRPTTIPRVFPWPVYILFLVFLTGCATKAKPTLVPSYKGGGLTGFQGRVEKGPHLGQENVEQLENLPARALIERAQENLVNGTYQMAGLYFSMALKKDPESDVALSGLGEILFREKKYIEAKGTFEKAFQKNKKSLPALMGMGKACRALREYDTAAEHLSRAADLQPDDPAILAELGITYEASGRGEKAEPFFRWVTELSPQSAWAYNNLGFNLLLQERYKEAVPVLERAVELNPDDGRIQNNLAVAYALAREEEKALRLFHGSVGKAGAYNNLGYVHMVLGNWQEAEKAFKQALELSPVFYARAKENLERLKEIRKRH